MQKKKWQQGTELEPVRSDQATPSRTETRGGERQNTHHPKRERQRFLSRGSTCQTPAKESSRGLPLDKANAGDQRKKKRTEGGEIATIVSSAPPDLALRNGQPLTGRSPKEHRGRAQRHNRQRKPPRVLWKRTMASLVGKGLRRTKVASVLAVPSHKPQTRPAGRSAEPLGASKHRRSPSCPGWTGRCTFDQLGNKRTNGRTQRAVNVDSRMQVTGTRDPTLSIIRKASAKERKREGNGSQHPHRPKEGEKGAKRSGTSLVKKSNKKRVVGH